MLEQARYSKVEVEELLQQAKLFVTIGKNYSSIDTKSNIESIQGNTKITVEDMENVNRYFEYDKVAHNSESLKVLENNFISKLEKISNKLRPNEGIKKEELSKIDGYSTFMSLHIATYDFNVPEELSKRAKDAYIASLEQNVLGESTSIKDVSSRKPLKRKILRKNVIEESQLQNSLKLCGFFDENAEDYVKIFAKATKQMETNVANTNYVQQTHNLVCDALKGINITLAENAEELVLLAGYSPHVKGGEEGKKLFKSVLSFIRDFYPTNDKDKENTLENAINDYLSDNKGVSLDIASGTSRKIESFVDGLPSLIEGLRKKMNKSNAIAMA